MRIDVKTLLIIALAMIAGLTASMRAGAQSNEWQPPEFFAAFDRDGSGAVHIPELDEWGEFCLMAYQCAGGELTWNHRNEPEYEVMLRADGSGYVYVVDDIYGFFCINGWDCAVPDEMPNPCDVDPEALGCIPAEEPIILPPPATYPTHYIHMPYIASATVLSPFPPCWTEVDGELVPCQ